MAPARAGARRFDPKVIVEAAIVGREVECGVLQYPDGRVEASLPAELHIPGEPTGEPGRTEGDAFYDFDTKYLDDVCTVDLPAELVKMITQQRSYQANAQTIKTQDQVMQTLVNLR